MAKQYIAEYQHNTHDKGQWKNASKYPKRYSETLEEARTNLQEPVFRLTVALSLSCT